MSVIILEGSIFDDIVKESKISIYDLVSRVVAGIMNEVTKNYYNKPSYTQNQREFNKRLSDIAISCENQYCDIGGMEQIRNYINSLNINENLNKFLEITQEITGVETFEVRLDKSLYSCHSDTSYMFKKLSSDTNNTITFVAYDYKKHN